MLIVGQRHDATFLAHTVTPSAASSGFASLIGAASAAQLPAEIAQPLATAVAQLECAECMDIPAALKVEVLDAEEPLSAVPLAVPSTS